MLHTQSIAWHLFDVTVLSQVERGLNPLRLARRLRGGAPQDISPTTGERAQSSFFTDRQLADLSLDDVRRGPTRPGEHPRPPFIVTRFKGEGKEAGCFVTDALGHRYLLKLDLVQYPELVTGAEVVTSKLLYALGYYVPSYEIVEVRPDQLRVGPSLPAGSDTQLTALLTPRLRDGHIRASASRILEGEILGPFRFKQFRHCPELRALRLAYAWLNNTDAKDHNTLMVWTGERAIGYLIDFGTSLGGHGERGPKGSCQGWVYDVDLAEGVFELLTLGLHDEGCDRRERPISPAVGLWSARFDPRRWKPYAPNLAFQDMTDADAEWMAARLARFSRAQLEAAVAAGRYHNPEDARRLLEVLEARRDVIVKTYLAEP